MLFDEDNLKIENDIGVGVVEDDKDKDEETIDNKEDPGFKEKKLEETTDENINKTEEKENHVNEKLIHKNGQKIKGK